MNVVKISIWALGEAAGAARGKRSRMRALPVLLLAGASRRQLCSQLYHTADTSTYFLNPPVCLRSVKLKGIRWLTGGRGRSVSADVNTSTLGCSCTARMSRADNEVMNNGLGEEGVRRGTPEGLAATKALEGFLKESQAADEVLQFHICLAATRCIF